MAKPKILLVDDVNLILELEKSFLKNSPVRVFTARNGEEALEVAARELPSLIFMDLNMPKLDGPGCCTRMKADPGLRSIPVVMVTTAGRDEDEQLCREAGCDDYITKPIDKRIFLEKARKFIPGIDRREPRIPCEEPVTVQKDEMDWSGVCTDLSVGGIYVAGRSTMVQDENIQLTLSLPKPGGGVITATGRVAWVNSEESRKKPRLPIGFGVEFTDIAPGDLEEVMKVVEQLGLKKKNP